MNKWDEIAEQVKQLTESAKESYNKMSGEPKTDMERSFQCSYVIGYLQAKLISIIYVNNIKL